MSDDTPITPSRDIARLIEIMAALRTPKTGCPWDLEQTFETIAPYTLEEAYEVADAIERGDLVDLKDELGDLLLQVVYHARLAEEVGAFSFGDIVEGVTKKMIRRHPHVFADATARAASDVNVLWERIKAEERAEKEAARASIPPPPRGEGEGVGGIPEGGVGGISLDAVGGLHDGEFRESPPPGLPHKGGREVAPSSHGEGEFNSILADIPAGLPALTRALKLQDKAAKVGFDWPNLAPVFDKLKEELQELEEVALPHDPRRVLSAPSDSPSSSRPEGAIKEELGDLLFVLANIARHLKIDPEGALRAANQKFIRRFTHIERRLAEKGTSPAHATLEDMDALWDEAKFLEDLEGE